MFYDLPPERSWTDPHCPSDPNWPLDWPALVARRAWLQALDGVPQDPDYHAEGDVLVHTGMVAEALVQHPSWQSLPSPARTALFVAALLHDVSKPQCTLIGPDGRISSAGHARHGELHARQILWQGQGFDTPAPFLLREQVARLVRWHGLPLWFLERPDLERAVVAASMTVPLERVALLAEADVLGRVCHDQSELLGRIALFREYCAELGCLSRPYPFPSVQSRYRYFASERGQLGYEPYDDTAFEVVLLCGLPASGKDTWIARELPELPTIALDQIRQQLHIAPRDNQGPVLAQAMERARNYLRRQQPFVWNATSITRSRRRRLIELFCAYKARVRLVYLDAPLVLLMERNARRPEPVPEGVILQMLRRLEVPDLTEAQRVEWLHTDDDA
jgi:predicted kinase